MFSISHFLVGLVVVALGAVSLKYNFQLVGLTGNQDWIESKLGGGSTYFVYKLLSLLVIVGGFLYGSGLINPFFIWLFSPILHSFGR